MRGAALVREALAQRPPGRFTLMAAIAAVHDEAPRFADTDWPQIVGLYDLLMRRWPSPVVALNRAVAVGFAGAPPRASRLWMPWPRARNWPATATCPPHGPTSCAASAGPARRAWRTRRRCCSTGNAVERDFLAARLDQLGP